MSESQLYHPISIYQTRILCLYGDDGSADSPLRCDLYPADILHPSFGGIGVRSQKNGEDFVVPYEALSYAWGAMIRSKDILCNDVPLPITENLHGALEVLRPPGNERRWLWIDALCIDQTSQEERSRQVKNMLAIYQSALKVIAWLGKAHEHTKVALDAASSVSRDWLAKTGDIVNVCKGLDDLYSRSWFKRMWVQQEIRAARQLVLCCGELQFSWPPELFNPVSILPPIQEEMRSKPGWHKSGWHKPTLPAANQEDPLPRVRMLMSALRERNLAHLRCFDRFSRWHLWPIDFVETLMITGLLQATDPKDYIYGILGLTNLPAQSRSLQEWAAARPTDAHIPIDYSADLADILTTVTWLTVMKCGVAIIAKFKSARSRSATARNNEDHLPSWVINWGVAAAAFQSVRPQRGQKFSEFQADFAITVDHPWDTWIKLAHLSSATVCRAREKGQIPSHQVEFMEDNLTNKHSFRKLVVRGVKAIQYYAFDGYVWEKERSGKDIKCWHVPRGTRSTDIVAFLFNFMGFGFKKLTWESYAGDGAEARRNRSGGLWLLRPVGKDEYTIVACLSWSKGEYLPMYDHWQWKGFQEDVVDVGEGGKHHRLSVEPLREGMDYKPGVKNGAVIDLYKFVIV